MSGVIALVALVWLISSRGLVPHAPGLSCSTFVLSREGGTLVVGHNLDENIKMPGLVVVNPRGIAKENVTFNDIESGRRSDSAPRLRWVSRYGSVTYNSFGREFPDGGMNEVGLYVGEMTLMGTVWPAESLPRMYHHQWIQYLLDNFATVEEAVASLSKALPEGHCQWHFLLADKEGGAAVVEFLEGKAVVHAGSALPCKILCNDSYEAELRDLVNYAGFGGTKNPVPRYEREDPRFRWAAVMLRDFNGKKPAVDYAFEVLGRLDVGNNKWSIVYDIPAARMYVTTSLARGIRWLNFADVDFVCTSRPWALDINEDLRGDVAKQLAPLTESQNSKAIAEAWAEIDAGPVGNVFFKPRMVRGLAAATASFTCAE
jgi:penicillin V acylase-like amidase (Ntn superfamily)